MEYQSYGREIEVPQPRAYVDQSQSQSLMPPQKGAYKFVLGHNWRSWRFVDSEDPAQPPEFLPVLWEGAVKAGCNGVPGLAPGQVHQWSHLAKMRQRAESKGVDVFGWGDRRLAGFTKIHPGFTGYMVPYDTSDGKKAFVAFWMKAIRYPSGDVVWRTDKDLKAKFLRYIRDNVSVPMVLEVYNKLFEVETRTLNRLIKEKDQNQVADQKARMSRMRAAWEALCAANLGPESAAAEIPQPVAETHEDDGALPQPDAAPVVKRGGK